MSVNLGKKTASGGDGNDKFIFARKTGQDMVEDFTLSGINGDKVDLTSDHFIL